MELADMSVQGLTPKEIEVATLARAAVRAHPERWAFK